jgi:glycosyltransferase involved in cell wall biosynthesis
VVTSDLTSMPETAGGAAVLVDPHDPCSIAQGMLDAVGASSRDLRARGLRRAGQFTWAATAEATLGVYRSVAEGRSRRRLG